ncbi:hypothetical protein FSP39_022023 [Pinctada imbricata]|uniref:Uncharacterized protein n=1 Tax=Pinctada imbricata TaxID=66713 RepID=A0AA89BQK7_PINIB|nr:hypothetical protein FSP39_022023 [Pinctada imbricata]
MLNIKYEVMKYDVIKYEKWIVPWFLRRHIPSLNLGPDISPLNYFPHADEDGVNINWAHGVNSEKELNDALSGKIDMIESDVMLRGQGTDTQTLVPVMAEYPATDSDLIFDKWLEQILVRPVWLHADVFQGPLGGKPRVDGKRFIKHVKRLFPVCTVSLGWTTGFHTDMSQEGYSWDNVLDMYHFIKDGDIEPPLVINVRASLIKNSVPQIKWLTDNTRSAILVWAEKEDFHKVHLAQDLMYISYRFAPHLSYFDIPREETAIFLKKNRNLSSDKLNPLVMDRQTVLFKPEAWFKMGLHVEAHSILPSEEALILQSRAVYILTKTKYRPSSVLSLNGRVIFLNRKNKPIVPGETGLNIYLRSTSYMDFEQINGIRCFIGLDGEVKVAPSHLYRLKDDFTKSMRFTVGTSNCIRFKVIDAINEIIFKLSVLHNCNTLESVQRDTKFDLEFKVKVSRDIGDEVHPFILKLEDSNRVAVLDELHVKHGENL